MLSVDPRFDSKTRTTNCRDLLGGLAAADKKAYLEFLKAAFAAASKEAGEARDDDEKRARAGENVSFAFSSLRPF